MFPHALAGARAAGLALLAGALLAACGSDDNPQTPAATPAASRLVVDTGSAAPVAGGTLTLKATLLAADGSEVKGASFAWTSSDPAVATVVTASDKAPAASVLAAAVAPVGRYTTVQTLAAGAADITATATLHALGGAGGAGQVVHPGAHARDRGRYRRRRRADRVDSRARSDGVDGAGDLTSWSCSSDEASLVATPAADGRSAQVASPSTAWGLAGFCPGPALVALGAGYPKAIGFVMAMVAGMVVFDMPSAAKRLSCSFRDLRGRAGDTALRPNRLTHKQHGYGTGTGRRLRRLPDGPAHHNIASSSEKYDVASVHKC